MSAAGRPKWARRHCDALLPAAHGLKVGVLTPIERSPARALVLLLSYILGVFALGALLGYPLYLLVTSLGFEEVRFHKLVIRSLKVLAIAGLFPLMAAVGLNRRAHWGYGSSPGEFVRALGQGLVIGIVILASLTLALLLLEVRVLDPALAWSPADLALLVVEASLAGLLIGFIEETWFRGALYGLIRETSTVWFAVVGTALLYGLVHFIRADVAIPPQSITWTSGFEVLAGSFGRFSSVGFVSSLLALVAAGVFLALFRCASGTIAGCIGVHAGWVIVIKSTRELSIVNPDSPWSFLIGSYDGIIGLLALIWLGMLSIAYYLMVIRRANPSFAEYP